MKKGFTLIELLAVIVILAIIALIATPIVLNIIKDSKESTTIRSAENYIDAVEQAIAQEKMINTNFNPTTCTTTLDGNLLCDGKTIKVSFNGSKPTKVATIKFNKGSVVAISNFNIGGKDVLASTLGLYDALICTLKSGTAKVVGSKYECEVKTGTKYLFYVLSSNTNGTYNLIMDQNINSDGTPAGITLTMKTEDNVYNIVAWQSSGIITYGPTTLINFLNTATSSWTNLLVLNESYIDEGGKYGSITFTGRARVPYKREIDDKLNSAFLYDNLGFDSPDIAGYWLATSVSSSLYSSAWCLTNAIHDVISIYIVSAKKFGIRPVITVSL